MVYDRHRPNLTKCLNEIQHGIDTQVLGRYSRCMSTTWKSS